MNFIENLKNREKLIISLFLGKYNCYGEIYLEENIPTIRMLTFDNIKTDQEFTEIQKEIEKDCIYFSEYGRCDGVKFTLLNFFGYKEHSYSKKDWRNLIFKYKIIITDEVDNLEKIYNNCDFLLEIGSFDDWFIYKDFKEPVWEKNYYQFTHSYSNIESIFLENCKIQIEKRIEIKSTKNSHSLKYKYYFIISSNDLKKPLNILQIIKLGNSLSKFISFLTRSFSRIKDLKIEFENPEKDIQYFDNDFSNEDEHKKIGSYSGPLNFYDIENKFLETFSKFKTFYTKNPYPIDIFLSDSLIKKQPGIYKFLHLFIALENFAEEDKKDIISKKKKPTNKEILEHYVKKFENINYVENFKKTSLFEKWLKNNNLVRIAEARNHYTHGSKNSPFKKPFIDENSEGLYAFYFMKCLLEHIILYKLGFSENFLLSLWSRNDNKIPSMSFYYNNICNFSTYKFKS